MIDPIPDTTAALFWGYLVVWSLLSLYFISLGMRCSRLEKRLREQQSDRHSG